MSVAPPKCSRCDTAALAGKSLCADCELSHHRAWKARWRRSVERLRELSPHFAKVA